MTLYVSNRDGDGKTDEKGHYKFPGVAFSGEVVVPGLTVTQNSPIGMSVIIEDGDFRVPAVDYAYTGWNSINTVATISTSDPANARIDTVVLYIDKSASTSPSPPNNPDVAKIKIVAGIPGAMPVHPNGTSIQSSIGAGNPYIILADVRVNAATSTITNANITDLRQRVTIADDLVIESSIEDGSITSSKIATSEVKTANINDGSIINSKLSDGVVTTRKFMPTIINSNFTPAASRYSTSTVGIFAIPNCTMSYTAGATNETIIVWTEAMAQKSTSGNAEIYLYVDGVAYGTNAYLDSGSPWYRINFMNMINLSAGQTVSLSIRVQNASTTAVAITNETARWMPSIKGFSIYRP